jgi:hypothetical protein
MIVRRSIRLLLPLPLIVSLAAAPAAALEPAGAPGAPDLPQTPPPPDPPGTPLPGWDAPATAEPTLPEGTPDRAPSRADPVQAGGLGAFGGFGLGGPGMGGLGGAGIFSGGPGYSAAWYPSRPVSGQAADLGLVRQRLGVAAPVWAGGDDRLLLTANVSDAHFATAAVLPDSRRPFPDDLWSINVGLNYMRQFANGWSGGLMTSFGSSSDQPFHSLREMNVGLGAMLRVPARNDRDFWTFGVMYSPAGTLNFPVPLVSYAWNPSETFRMSIGLPLALTWRPTEDWTLNVSYVPLTNVNATVTYRVLGNLRVYGGYQYLTESYFLADRADAQDRFFGLEQRLFTGVRWDLGRRASLDVSGGYVFGRQYGEGTNQSAALHDRVDIAPGAFLGAKFSWRF